MKFMKKGSMNLKTKKPRKFQVLSLFVARVTVSTPEKSCLYQ